MAGWMISRKVIGPSERPMRFSHPRLSASSTIHLPGWAPWNGTTAAMACTPVVEPVLELCVGDVTCHHHRTGQHHPRLHRELRQLGPDLVHRTVEVDLDHIIRQVVVGGLR